MIARIGRFYVRNEHMSATIHFDVNLVWVLELTFNATHWPFMLVAGDTLDEAFAAAVEKYKDPGRPREPERRLKAFDEFIPAALSAFKTEVEK